MHPQHRQPSRSGAVDLRVPDLQPRESGERPSSQPLPQRPCRGVHRQQPGRFARRRDARHDPAEHGGIERETRDEPHRQRERQRPRHVGELEALVHPGDAGAEGPEPEQPAAEEGETRRTASVPREKQHGKGGERDGKEPERGERERKGGAGRKTCGAGRDAPRRSTPAGRRRLRRFGLHDPSIHRCGSGGAVRGPALPPRGDRIPCAETRRRAGRPVQSAPPSPPGGRTRSRWTRRLSARTTVKRNPSRVTCS